MKTETLIKNIEVIGSSAYIGVPDSQLKPLIDYLIDNFGISEKHTIAANEGNAVAIAAGYYLATNKTPVVYMQNSGIGNAINPVTSLLNNEVYGIPCIFIIGWRGEPGVNDEPQHIYQGEITKDLLEQVGIKTIIVDKETKSKDLEIALEKQKPLFAEGKSIALLVKKGALEYQSKTKEIQEGGICREEAIRVLVQAGHDDVFVSTTGKTSRELFEIRAENNQSHKHDFLTVGSMGHSSSVALGIALNKPNTRVWCIDGDGALLMHMGAMALIGSKAPRNFVHVLINNYAHESVGGQPTVAKDVDFGMVAKGCNYRNIFRVDNYEDLESVSQKIRQSEGPIFLEVKTIMGSRDNLGRPTTSPKDNKESFMKFLKECK